jgi:uncharacterized protein YdcH (DUF465 family)
MLLTQMGAKVTSIHGVLFYVKFIIGEVEIFYVFNVNAKNQYYLQRVLPYPVGAGAFESPDLVIDYIREDIEKFKNASQSSRFSDFITVSSKLHKIVHGFEELFLDHNVLPDQMEAIEKSILELSSILEKSMKKSPLI